MIYRYGLRVSEAGASRRGELDLDRARTRVRRLKGGLSVEQPIAGDELRDQALSRHPQRRPAMAVPVQARRAPACRPASAHAPALLRLRASRQGPGPPAHSGLPGPMGSPSHGPLHPDCWAAFRGAGALTPDGQNAHLCGHWAVQRTSARLEQEVGAASGPCICWGLATRGRAGARWWRWPGLSQLTGHCWALAGTRFGGSRRLGLQRNWRGDGTPGGPD